MNTLEFDLLAQELASARANATLGVSHLDQVRRVATINGAVKTAPLHLAAYYFNEAAKLIDQALGKTPTPAAPSLDEMIELAKSRDEVGRVAPLPSPLEGEGQGEGTVGSSDPLALSAQEPPEASHQQPISSVPSADDQSTSREAENKSNGADESLSPLSHP